METKIDLADGKYTVMHNNGANLRALRYGESWRDLTGDNLVYYMACRIEELEQAIQEIKDAHVFNVAAMVPTQVHAICHRVVPNDRS